MEIAAFRLFYDNVHDFKTTAMHVDSENLPLFPTSR